MCHNFIFYIHTNILNSSIFANENFGNVKEVIIPLLEISRQLKAEVYYSFNDVQLLKNDIGDMDIFFTKSQANFLDILLKDFKANKLYSNFFEVNFINSSTNLRHVDYTFLKEEDLYSNKKHIVLSIGEEKHYNLLNVTSNDKFERISIFESNDKNNIWKYICENLPKRNYNFSKKHGNNITKASSPNGLKASQLLCSDEEAQKLLHTAIFDVNQKGRFLYNFDKQHQTFILFPYEGDNPQNNYHAFHIEKSEWNKEVPLSIRKYFNKD